MSGGEIRLSGIFFFFFYEVKALTETTVQAFWGIGVL